MTTSADLGEYEGLPVTSVQLVLKMPGGPLNPALAVSAAHISRDDDVYLLVQGKAGAVKYDPKDEDAWTRVHTLNVGTFTLVDADFADEKIAAQEIANKTALALAKERDNRKKGIITVPGIGLDKGPTLVHDEHGNVLTDREVAEMRGVGVEPRPSVLVEFNDDVEQRKVWPDDLFGWSYPMVGDSNPEFGDVTALIDMVSGAVLAGTSEGVAAVDDDLSGELYPSTEGGSDDALTDAPSGDTHGAPDVDGWDTPDPATAERIAAAEHDPAVVEWLSVSTAEVKANVAANSSAQWLRQALQVESNGPNKPRGAVVNALSARLEELGS